MSNLLKDVYPWMFNQVHPILNGNIDIHNLTVSSGIRVLWYCYCKFCGQEHTWETRIADRTKNAKPSECPYCVRNGKKVCPCRSVAVQCPALLLDFNPNLNPGINLYSLREKSNEVVNWSCHRAKCEHHHWQAKIKARAEGNGCPFCSGDYLDPCFSAAKMYPHLVKQLHPILNRPDLNLDKLPHGSSERIWWLCENGECGHHIWDTFLYSRASDNGSGCPYCSQKRCCPCTSIVVTHPQIAAEYDLELNKRDINTVSRCSIGKFWWKCATHGSWEALVSNRTRKNYGCPKCSVSHMEKKCIDLLMGVFGLEIKIHFDTEYSFANCVNPDTNHLLKFDIIIKNAKYIVLIELDGEQHFSEMRFFHQSATLEVRKKRDLIKNLYCHQNKISLLRISHTEVDNMLEHLTAFLGAIVDDNTPKPIVMFFGKEYQDQSYLQ